MNQAIAETDVQSEDEETPARQSRLTSIAASLLPFLQSIPPLAAWGGLMTIPLVSYIALLFASGPSQFAEALFLLFFGGFLWEQITAVLGLGILVYSFVHMRLTKKEGLITTGPYRFVRHPQYLGVTLFTLTLTTRSYWIGTNTFGMSWIDPKLTVVIWFGTLVAYIILAYVEELHLAKTFGAEFEDYKQKTGFMFPGLKSQNLGLEVIVSTLFFSVVLFAIILMPTPMPPPGPMPGPGDATAPPF
ncbi:MAG: hypothetical protein JSW61_10990 [Candidatus Thorarchaeota archaeon]|nr:MAG: hypothetical protein JSW61_10990 [Candidatus Thorarchaeota archaeon]